MRNATLTFAAALVVGVLAGCPKYTEPVPRARELSAAEKNFESVWEASMRVLREYRFTPALQDRRSGLIQTQPMTSKHFTEFWRKEATTAEDVLEDSLHTIYRTATVRIVPRDASNEEFDVVVQVDVSRSDRRAPLVTSASQAYELFSTSAEERLLVRYEDQTEGPVVVPVARDENLEKILTDEIRTASRKVLPGE